MSESVGRWIRRAAIAAALALLIAAVLGFGYEQLGRWQDEQHPFRIGRAVDVGGRTLNISLLAKASPA